MQDDRFDSGLNTTLDTGSIIFKIFVCYFRALDQLRQALKSLDVAHQVPSATVGLLRLYN
jgi:hypothetical protein